MLYKNPISAVHYASTVISLFNIKSCALVIDRTNWQYGSIDYNLLVLSLIWNDLSIPIYWLHLDNKGGNSKSEQRIELVKWFTDNFATVTIEHVLADREFPSQEFISWLNQNNLPFVFRSKSSVLATDANKKVKVSTLFPNLHQQSNKTKAETKIRRIYNSRLYLTIRLNQDNEKVYIISNQKQDNAAEIYRKRWTIEAMFAKFKTKGLKLESTRIMKHQRIQSLFMLMSIAYCYAIKIGDIANKLKPNKLKTLKNHDSNTIRITPEHSIFNRGINLLKILVENYLSHSAVITKQLSKILSPDSQNSCINRCSALANIISAF